MSESICLRMAGAGKGRPAPAHHRSIRESIADIGKARQLTGLRHPPATRYQLVSASAGDHPNLCYSQGTQGVGNRGQNQAAKYAQPPGQNESD